MAVGLALPGGDAIALPSDVFPVKRSSRPSYLRIPTRKGRLRPGSHNLKPSPPCLQYGVQLYKNYQQAQSHHLRLSYLGSPPLVSALFWGTGGVGVQAQGSCSDPSPPHSVLSPEERLR